MLYINKNIVLYKHYKNQETKIIDKLITFNFCIFNQSIKLKLLLFKLCLFINKLFLFNIKTFYFPFMMQN